MSHASREKKPSREPASRGVPVLAMLALAAIGGLGWAATSPFTAILFRPSSLRASSGEPDLAALLASPLAVAALASVGALVLGVLHLTRVRLPTLAIAGLGAIVAGIAGILTMWPGAEQPTRAAIIVAMVVLAIGEVLFAPFLLSRATGDLPRRLETTVAAVWLAASEAPAIGYAIIRAQNGTSRELAWAGVAVVMLIGLALVVAARPLRRVLAPPVEASVEDRHAAAGAQR